VKAINPTTLEGKATMQKIGPAAAKENIPGLRGKTIDLSVRDGLAEATEDLHAARERLSSEVRPEFQINMDRPRFDLEAALRKLQKRPDLHADAIRELQVIQKEFNRLPKYAPFEDVLALREDLDNWIAERGGFRNASTGADRLAMQAKRGGADLLRRELNDLDPTYKAANQRFSLFTHLDDIVARREMGEVGKTGAALPGRGSILDDILATWAGKAVGGTAGGVTMEGLNLAAQSRGWANARSSFQMKAADFIRKAPARPAALLTEGAKPLPPTPDASGVSATKARFGKDQQLLPSRTAITPPPPPDASSVRGVPAELARREIRGLLPPAKKEAIPLPPSADTTTLEVVDAQRGLARDPKTGRMFRYYTQEPKKKP